jgi:hypothetical protein
MLTFRSLAYFSPGAEGGGAPTGQVPTNTDPNAQSGQVPDTSGGQNNNTQPRLYDEAYVQKLRSEAASHRTTATAAQAKLKEIEDAGKSELQKAQDRLKELEKQNSDLQTAQQQRVNHDKLVDAATVAQARKPAIVARLLAAEAIKTSADGSPDAVEVKAAIDRLIASDPELFLTPGPAGSGAGAGKGASSGTNMNDWLRAKAR